MSFPSRDFSSYACQRFHREVKIETRLSEMKSLHNGLVTSECSASCNGPVVKKDSSIFEGVKRRKKKRKREKKRNRKYRWGRCRRIKKRMSWCRQIGIDRVLLKAQTFNHTPLLELSAMTLIVGNPGRPEPQVWLGCFSYYFWRSIWTKSNFPSRECDLDEHFGRQALNAQRNSYLNVKSRSYSVRNFVCRIKDELTL